MIDVTKLVAAIVTAMHKGDKPGHAFRGNQHTRGGGKGGKGPRPSNWLGVGYPNKPSGETTNAGPGKLGDPAKTYTEESDSDAARQRISEQGRVTKLEPNEEKRLDMYTRSKEGEMAVDVVGLRGTPRTGTLVAVNDRSGGSSVLRAATVSQVGVRKNPRMGEGKTFAIVSFSDGREAMELVDIVGQIRSGS